MFSKNSLKLFMPELLAIVEEKDLTAIHDVEQKGVEFLQDFLEELQLAKKKLAQAVNVHNEKLTSAISAQQDVLHPIKIDETNDDFILITNEAIDTLEVLRQKISRTIEKMHAERAALENILTCKNK